MKVNIGWSNVLENVDIKQNMFEVVSINCVCVSEKVCELGVYCLSNRICVDKEAIFLLDRNLN